MLKTAHGKLLVLDLEQHILFQSDNLNGLNAAIVDLKLSKYGKKLLSFKIGKNVLFIKDIYDMGKVNFSFSEIKSNVNISNDGDCIVIECGGKYLSAVKDDQIIRLAPHAKGWEKFIN